MLGHQMKDKRLHILVNDTLYNQVHTLSGERGVSEFIRQAIEEKISNISQNGKALKQLINNNSSVEIKEIQNQLGEVQIQNKVLFEQQQRQLDLFKLILRRSTSGALNSSELIKQLAPQVNSKAIGEELSAIVKRDIEALKL